MSVPYETAAYEPPESPESPEEHLARLLGRALNSFELPDETIRQLTDRGRGDREELPRQDGGARQRAERLEPLVERVGRGERDLTGPSASRSGGKGL